MTKYVLSIDGMMCSMCEAHINDAVRRALPEAKKVSSSHKKGETVFISENAVDEAKLKSAIDETGYILNKIEKQPYEKKGFWHR